jgi:hypothetical protein
MNDPFGALAFVNTAKQYEANLAPPFDKHANIVPSGLDVVMISTNLGSVPLSVNARSRHFS